jgi:hypothetical protein
MKYALLQMSDRFFFNLRLPVLLNEKRMHSNIVLGKYVKMLYSFAARNHSKKLPQNDMFNLEMMRKTPYEKLNLLVFIFRINKP